MFARMLTAALFVTAKNQKTKKTTMYDEHPSIQEYIAKLWPIPA